MRATEGGRELDAVRPVRGLQSCSNPPGWAAAGFGRKEGARRASFDAPPGRIRVPCPCVCGSMWWDGMSVIDACGLGQKGKEDPHVDPFNPATTALLLLPRRPQSSIVDVPAKVGQWATRVWASRRAHMVGKLWSCCVVCCHPAAGGEDELSKQRVRFALSRRM